MKLKKDVASEQQVQARLSRLVERMAGAIRAALHLGNDGKASIEEQAAIYWDGEYGSLDALLMEQEAANDHYRVLRKKLAVAQIQDNDVPAFIEGKEPSDNDAVGVIGFSRFLPIDRWRLMLFGGISIGALVLSLVNTYVALRSSYIPAIESSPWKGWLIAGIAPAISCSLKLLVGIFGRPKFNEFARKTLYVSTAFLGMLWLYLFSAQFDGFSAGDDWSTPVSSVLGLSFTHLQLLVEVCCGSSMMVACQSILDRYQSFPPIPNLAKGLTSEYARQLQLACDKALKDFEQKDNALKQRQSARQSFISEQVNSFQIALARHNDLHGKSGE